MSGTEELERQINTQKICEIFNSFDTNILGKYQTCSFKTTRCSISNENLLELYQSLLNPEYKSIFTIEDKLDNEDRLRRSWRLFLKAAKQNN